VITPVEIDSRKRFPRFIEFIQKELKASLNFKTDA
tara:strand:- start:441 stop:545 length:105 start_codon:yes stop_codon:yes gene_type:complete